jgi:excisionase family DNA binding protein
MTTSSARALASVHQPSENDSAEIQELYRLFLLEKAPALLGLNRESIPIPESVFNVLRQVIGYMRQGKGVSVVPVMEELTTQRTANLLGVSRPFVIDLLNRNEIPHHKAGTHRRIYLKDVIEYRNKRDQERKKILAEIAKQALSDGDYDQVYIPEAVDD